MNKENTQNNIWGIIGLGWLGKALQAHLDKNQISSWGTHRTEFNWAVDSFPKRPCNILFLNPPPLTEISAEEFINKIPLIANQRILFISSISVYGTCEGNVTEDTSPNPTTNSGRWLLEVEHRLLEKFGTSLTIIRPGGLMGDHRHPAISLSKRGASCVALTPINLIHRDDLVEIIWRLAQTSETPSIVNAVTPFHPTKKDYYSSWTKKLGLPDINFSQALEPRKTVSSNALPKIYPAWIHPTLDSL